MNTIIKGLLRNPIRLLDRKIRSMEQETFNTIMNCIVGALILGAALYLLPDAIHLWLFNLDQKYLEWLKQF
jgi:hypothetical protein